GYDPLLLESFCTIQRWVYYIENEGGTRKFVDQEDHTKLTSGGLWHDVKGVTQPVNSGNTFLTVHTSQAVAIGLAKGEAANIDALASQKDLAVVKILTASFTERSIEILSTNI